MTELSYENFDLVQVDDGDWEEEQWEQSKVVFDGFYEYLQEKGLKESTAAEKTNMVAFFFMKFVFVYLDDIESILHVGDDVVRVFLGNWYIRKFFHPRTSEINKFLTAIANFYTFLNKKGFYGKTSLTAIKEVCKDKEWFAERLRSYFESEGEDFEDWVMEYNYDF
jgi:site-specific recombinase XerD